MPAGGYSSRMKNSPSRFHSKSDASDVERKSARRKRMKTPVKKPVDVGSLLYRRDDAQERRLMQSKLNTFHLNDEKKHITYVFKTTFDESDFGLQHLNTLLKGAGIKVIPHETPEQSPLVLEDDVTLTFNPSKYNSKENGDDDLEPEKKKKLKSYDALLSLTPEAFIKLSVAWGYNPSGKLPPGYENQLLVAQSAATTSRTR